MKKFLTASSVAGLVGLAPMAVEERDVGGPGGRAGWWRRRNFTFPPVTKQET
jgi:hypothetical protein